MIIKSTFKDYYDFVAHQFGGGDPKVVYTRGRLVPQKQLDGNLYDDVLEVEIDACNLRDPNPSHSFFKDSMHLMYLVVAGRGYLIGLEQGQSAKVNEHKLLPVDYLRPHVWRPSWHKANDYYGFAPGEESEILIRISRLVNAPVFAISGFVHDHWSTTKRQKSIVRIAGQCPVLKNIGLAALIDPYQMYQNIAYFMGNTIKSAPDTAPPVEVSNREKILKAGFDLKQSFRHRKET